jgi:hypothetical protein
LAAAVQKMRRLAKLAPQAPTDNKTIDRVRSDGMDMLVPVQKTRIQKGVGYFGNTISAMRRV